MNEDNKPAWLYVVEFATGLVAVWASIPEIRRRAMKGRMLLGVSRAASRAAAKFGQVSIDAEDRYYKEIRR